MSNPNGRGKFVWYELMSTDPAKAADFYSKLLHWTIRDAKAAVPYSFINSKTTQIGGIMGVPPDLPYEIPSHWLAYVLVPDLAASEKQVKELGGSIVMGPKEVPDMGKFLIIRDPQGAMIALWESSMQGEPPSAQPRSHGDVMWHELMTTDYEAAFKFYSALLGWEKDRGHDMGSLGVYQLFSHNGEAIGGMFNRMPGMDAPPSWTLYFDVSDLNAAITTAKANGARLIHGPAEVPGGGMIANFIDPTGANFALHYMKGSPA